jgi:hypothetical protein
MPNAIELFRLRWPDVHRTSLREEAAITSA